MPRNPKSYPSKSDKKAAVAPLLTAVGDATRAVANATKQLKDVQRIAKANAKQFAKDIAKAKAVLAAAQAKKSAAAIRLEAYKAIPIVPVAKKPAKPSKEAAPTAEKSAP